MSKWARVNLEQEGPICEIITYDPVGVINEAFLPLFKPCSDEVEKGYWYNPQTDTFYLPDGYVKHPDFDVFGYVPQGDYEVDENGFAIIPPPPEPPVPEKYISLEEFRSQLTLSEKVLWDNPETGSSTQTAVINTAKQEFPLLVGSQETVDVLDLLEAEGVIGVDRASVILSHFE